MFDKLNGGISPSNYPHLYMLDWLFEHDTLEFRAKCRVLGLKHDIALHNLSWDENDTEANMLHIYNEAYRYYITNFGGYDESAVSYRTLMLSHSILQQLMSQQTQRHRYFITNFGGHDESK
jgi:hypothetical protein